MRRLFFAVDFFTTKVLTEEVRIDVSSQKLIVHLVLKEVILIKFKFMSNRDVFIQV